MQYVRPVDFGAFPRNEFNSQRLADRSAGLGSCVCLCTRVPPGRKTNIGLHTHTVDQLYFILRGTMTAEIGGHSFEAGPWSLVYIPAGVPHYNWNSGTEDELHFEYLVPSPLAGEPLAHAASEATHPREVDPSRVQLVRHVDHSQFDPDKFSWVTLGDRASGIETVSLGLFRVPAGGQSPALHAHHFDQIYYVVSGTLRLRIGFEQYEAPANSLVILPAGMPHANWNEGPDVVYFLNLRTPEPELSDEVERWDTPVSFG